jgi:hypothetical protein
MARVAATAAGVAADQLVIVGAGERARLAARAAAPQLMQRGRVKPVGAPRVPLQRGRTRPVESSPEIVPRSGQYVRARTQSERNAEAIKSAIWQLARRRSA